MIDACRDWRAWLRGLDNVPEQDGITGLVTSNCHWLAFCRRQDVPIECAAIYGDLSEPGITSALGDVMCLVKEYMSDAALAQRPFCCLRAGASNLLPNPTGPVEWEKRNELKREEKQGISRLCDKIRRILPLRCGAATYMEEYMAKPLTPSEPPRRLQLFSHVTSQTSRSLGPALTGAVEHASVPDDDVRMVGVRRRKAAMPCADSRSMPLHSFVAFRCQQGVAVEQAVQEWNGWQIAARGLRVANDIPAPGGTGALPD